MERLIHDGEGESARERLAPKASRLPTAILGVAAVAFLVLEFRLILSRGPLTLRAPETWVSNGPATQRTDIPFFRVLRQVRGILPPGATVAVLGPNLRTEIGPMEDLIAIGQLPHNDVVPARAVVERKTPPPQYVAVQQSDFSDDRYRVVAILESGRLYERQH
jgi:hypothetical protein